MCLGLQCWTCENQPSMFQCMFNGEIKTCESNQVIKALTIIPSGGIQAVRTGSIEPFLEIL